MKDRPLVAVLLAGFALLFLELRFEHREVLGETWHAWIPLVYAAVALAVGIVAVARWSAALRRSLAIVFALGIAIGLVGFWFHTGQHPLHAAHLAIEIWSVPLGKNGGIAQGSEPPVFAPFSLCGLGTVGAVLAWPRASSPRRP